MANKNDLVILAGKGHETYQEINGVKHPFHEKEIVKEYIEKLAEMQKNEKSKK